MSRQWLVQKIPEYAYMLNTQCKFQSLETVALLATSPVLGSPVDFHPSNQAYNQLL